MDELSKIYSDIREVKIQGATNIAKAAIKAYLMKPTKKTKKRLLSLRPTEPMLSNVLNFLEKWPKERIISHFYEAQKKIDEFVLRLIKKNSVIYTHCHSSNVIKALIYAKKKGKKFSVVNTETRPLFQGRKTARELGRAGIKVTTFIDSGMDDAITEADSVFLGADAILRDRAINKIGSEAIAEIAYIRKKPVYILADSWKFSPKNVKIEERNFHEVWKIVPEHVKVVNPAFEKIPKKYIKKVVSEYGILGFDAFVKKADRVI